MKIDDAIRNNQVVYVDLRLKDKLVLAKSVRLGIEALKCIKQMRSLYTSGFSNPLPGETE